MLRQAYLKQAGDRKIKVIVESISDQKGLTYAYRDRKAKKRDYRALWIQRINAGAREHGISYSQLMGMLKKANIDLNRKVLADLAMNHPAAFKAVVDKIKK